MTNTKPSIYKTTLTTTCDANLADGTTPQDGDKRKIYIAGFYSRGLNQWILAGRGVSSTQATRDLNDMLGKQTPGAQASIRSYPYKEMEVIEEYDAEREEWL